MKGTLRASPRSTIPQQGGARPGGRDAIAQPQQQEPVIDLDQGVQETQKPRFRLAPPVPVAVARTPFVILVIMVVVAGVLGILVLNTKINENAFQLSALREEQGRLNLQQQQLERKIAEQESPGNLAALGRRLGLVDPGAPAFIRLPDGKIIGVPKPASGSPSITSQ